MKFPHKLPHSRQMASNFALFYDFAWRRNQKKRLHLHLGFCEFDLLAFGKIFGNWFQTKYKICKFCFDFVFYMGSTVVLNFDVYNQN